MRQKTHLRCRSRQRAPMPPGTCAANAQSPWAGASSARGGSAPGRYENWSTGRKRRIAYSPDSIVRPFGRCFGGAARALQQGLDIVADHAGLQSQTFLGCAATEELLEVFQIFLDAVLHKTHPFSGDVLHAVNHESRALEQGLHVAGGLLHGFSRGVAGKAEQL